MARANRRGKPKGYQPALVISIGGAQTMGVTTFPWRKNQHGKTEPVPGMRIFSHWGGIGKLGAGRMIKAQ